MTRNPSPDETLLTAIVPISMMAGRMDRLDCWLSNLGNLPINVVIIHDIRDDNTQSELESLLANYEDLNISFISGKFGSPGAARNTGLKTKLATWVSFWDSDDLPDPHSYIKAIAEASASTEIIIGNFIVNSPEGVESIQHHDNLQKVALSPGIWRFIFKSEVIQNKYFTEARMGEDQVFLLETNVGKKNVMFTENIFYEYFQDSSLQLTSDQIAINEVNSSFNYAKHLLNEYPRLRDNFAQIVLTRLFLTTLLRCKPENKLKFLLINLSQIILLHPTLFIHVLLALWNQSQRRKK